jgi:putative transposase
MSELRKTNADDLYFVTLTVVDWINLFDREIYKQIMIENLKHCQDKENLDVFAYVIMSNHLHMVCRRIDKDLNELLGRFKSFTSKQFLKEIQNNPKESRKEWLLQLFSEKASQNKQYSKFHIWQYTNHPTLLYYMDVIQQKMSYIHDNPVRAGYVFESYEYKYSSANMDSPLKVKEI